MPMVSQAQRRWMHANKPKLAQKWEDETPTGRRLPRKLGKSTKPKRRSKNV